MKKINFQQQKAMASGEENGGGLRLNSADEGGVHGVDEKERKGRRVVVCST